MSRLPVITDKPYTPKRNLKYGMPQEQECASDWCKRERNPAPHTHLNEHTDPPVNGSGWLERKASGEIVYHTPWIKTHKPFELKPLKPRVETANKALLRMRKECVTPDDRKRFVGLGLTDGFVITATNDHWVLLEPGQGTGQTLDSLGITSEHQPIFLDDPEFYLALKRAKIMADEKSNCVYLTGEENEIRISTYSRNEIRISTYSRSEVRGADGLETFDETIPAAFERPWKTALDADYLEIALGSWPITIYVKDDESAVIFEPINREWRFILMPMRAEWDKLPKFESEGL